MPDKPTNWLDPFAVSSDPTGNQYDPSIVQLADGRIIVAWTTDNETTAGSSGLDIGGRILDPLGEPLGDDIQVNSSSYTGYFIDDEKEPDLAALPDGGYLLALVDDEAIFGGNPDNIRLSHYDSTGAIVANVSLQTDAEAGAPYYSDPQVAVSSATSALIVFLQNDGAGDADVYYTLYNPTTNVIATPPTLIMSNGTSELADLDIAVLSNGNYVFVAASNGDVVMRGLTDTGASAILSSYVNSFNDGFTDSEPSIAALAGGGFVVSWTSVNDGTGDSDIRYKIFDGTGSAVTSALTARGNGFDNCGDSEVVGLADGNFVIVYADYDSNVLFADHFADDGTRLGRLAFADISADIDGIEAISLADGRFAVTWHEAGGEVQTAILDTRDAPNGTSVYAPDGYVIGTPGDDNFTADSAADFVYGFDGNDVIHESGPTRSYFGGEGNDTLKVTSVINADVHDGGKGNDRIDFSGSGEIGLIIKLAAEIVKDIDDNSEQIISFEKATGTIGDDLIIGTSGANAIRGGDGQDTIKGNGGGDNLRGDDGKDVLLGGGGNDKLRGGDGNDELRGNSGHDKIQGDAGRDKLWGNSGNDTFVFKSVDDSGKGFQADQIMDFNRSDDLIDLRALGPNVDVTTQSKGYGTLVKVDVDDNGSTDFHIKVLNVSNLNDSDFIF